jgi:hypothetical protein
MFFACGEKSPPHVDTGKQANQISFHPGVSPNDTVVIYEEDGAAIAAYTMNQLNEIVAAYPLLLAKKPVHPDTVYTRGTQRASVHFTNFSSESGYDDFYCVYAWFAKKKKGENEFSKERGTLIEILRNINHLFMVLNYGGTYYGHQYIRSIGFAEYSIDRYRQNPMQYNQSRTFGDEKKAFLDTLRKRVRSGLQNDEEYKWMSSVTQPDKSDEIYEQVGKLEKLITNSFYLHTAMEFWKSQYDF